MPSQPLEVYLIVQNQIFPLVHPVTAIGRRLTNHLVVDDPRVSRIHAQIRFVKGQYFIVDLNSKGGTFVNSEKVSQALLFSGDMISLSGFDIKFIQGSEQLEKDSEEYTSPQITKVQEDKKTVPTKGKMDKS